MIYFQGLGFRLEIIIPPWICASLCKSYYWRLLLYLKKSPSDHIFLKDHIFYNNNKKKKNIWSVYL
jgi:hypothetical protein